MLTFEYKVNFLRPAAGALLMTEGLVLRAGRSVIVTRVDVSAVADGKTTLCSALQQSIVPAAGAWSQPQRRRQMLRTAPHPSGMQLVGLSGAKGALNSSLIVSRAP